jgi:single-stranded-DNA-specific exonuclease
MATFASMRWMIKPADSQETSRLAADLGIPPLVAQLLVQRGIGQSEQAHRFLHPSLAHLHNPFLMAGMRDAVERIHKAIARREKILIYGDYDVDGTMAVVILLTALKSLGANPSVYIPNRLTDGYGMRAAVVQQAAAEGVRLVISVDTGIREHDVITRARELGIETIVTDHHLPEDRLPPAVAVLNPHRPDCPYPEKNLCGAGVVFKLVQALLGARMSEKVLRSYLKVVTIGTVADVVPLRGENRVIVRFGLDGLSLPARGGLASLLEVSGLTGGAVTAGAVGFRLAPRINAAGRMHSAKEVIELFTAVEPARAREIAQRLDELNRERQDIEERIVADVAQTLDQRLRDESRYTLVCAREGWHRGVIGIAAQRIAERYHRPTLVITLENGVGYGSGRSIPGFHLLKALAASGELFERYGGHAQAAGFTIAADRVPELEGRFEAYARTVLTAADLEPVLRVDAEVRLRDLNRDLYQGLCRLAPHGIGNPTPVFAARGLRLLEAPRLLKEKHLKLRVVQVPGGRDRMDALAWRWRDRGMELAAGQEIDLAFELEESVHEDLCSLQLVVRDIHPRTAPACRMPEREAFLATEEPLQSDE